MQIKAALAAVALALLLGACAAPQTRALLQGPSTGLPQSIELGQTPFFPQELHQCGPAALATALGAAGIAAEPERIVPQVYLPEREGSLQVELLASARRHGAVAYELNPALEDLLAELAAGNPVMVLQNLGLSWIPRWHYAVAVGYDLGQGEIVLRSGRERRQVMSLNTFEHTWARSGRWAMLALAPGRLPATVQEAAYVSAVVALERTGSTRAARNAYAAAVQRWPKNLMARMGLGNTAYALKDLDAAEAAFRQAVVDHPDSAAAYNNLAHVLAQRHHYAEALVAARRAVELGGPQEAEARRTLAEIEAARSRKPKRP